MAAAASMTHSSRIQPADRFAGPEDREHDGEELDARLELAEHRGRHHLALGCDHPAQPHHDQLAADDERDDPGRCPAGGEQTRSARPRRAACPPWCRGRSRACWSRPSGARVARPPSRWRPRRRTAPPPTSSAVFPSPFSTSHITTGVRTIRVAVPAAIKRADCILLQVTVGVATRRARTLARAVRGGASLVALLERAACGRRSALHVRLAQRGLDGRNPARGHAELADAEPSEQRPRPRARRPARRTPPPSARARGRPQLPPAIRASTGARAPPAGRRAPRCPARRPSCTGRGRSSRSRRSRPPARTALPGARAPAPRP